MNDARSAGIHAILISMIYQLKEMSPRHKLLINCFLFGLIASCESKPRFCENKLIEVCDFDSSFDAMGRLSKENLILLTQTRSWKMSRGSVETDSVFIPL